MGIQGLLPLLKSIHKPTHLRSFAGQTLGVDAYGWLHRGTISCAIELAQQKPTRKHIDFALSRVRMLIHFGIKPYLVFDGAYLPSKEHTEKDRATRRKESKKLGLELLATGRVSQAYLELQKAIDVTPVMARELIDELKCLGVAYVVAPYEADSQLAFLEKQGLISGVISEDSDLLVFGVNRLLTKLDQYGECVMVNRADFTACRGISLVGWTDKEFRLMAMLSGCDYLPGIDRMGLKTAYRLVRKHKEVERLIRAVQFDGKMKVPLGYLEEFDRAEKTFLYQWVFSPTARCLVNLNSIPSDLQLKDMPFIGVAAEPGIAAGIAAGDLDPNTKERLIITDWSRSQPTSRSRSFATPDEKQGKPISEFFKPKRTPLAELDPNSFTPSPSQQALLESQRGASWSASQIHTAQSAMFGRVRSANATYSAPQVSRRTISDHFADTREKLPKTQRLCSESTLSGPVKCGVLEQSTTSRFFSVSNIERSPPTRKPHARKKRLDDFELWSDDPTAEAMAEITKSAEEGRASKINTKRIKVYTEPSNDDDQPASSEGRFEDCMMNYKQTCSEANVKRGTPLKALESGANPEEKSIVSAGIDAEFAMLRSKFSLSMSPSRKAPPRMRSNPLPARTPLLGDDPNHLLGRLAKKPAILTCGTGEAQPNALESAVVVPNSSPPLSATEQNKIEDKTLLSDQDWLELEHCAASPATSLLLQGSEDLLVPNSPESCGDSEGEKKRAVFNLGRFAFAGSC